MLVIDLLDTVGVTVVVVLLALAVLTIRRYLLQRGGGTVDVSLRLRSASHGRGWALGVGRYSDSQLAWYRVFSLAPRPRRCLSRSDLRIVRRRAPSGSESLSLLAGSVVLECTEVDGPVELAMSEAAVPGFLSWVESAPPGSRGPGG